MPRHKYRPNSYRGGHLGGSGSSSSSRQPYKSRDPDLVIKCNHCDTLLPHFRFPKSIVDKYTKKLKRGDDPAIIRAICRQCCIKPNEGKASSLAHIPPRLAPPALPPQPPPQQLRGHCKECRIEYPLTPEFFVRYQLRPKNAHLRVCFVCRNKQVLVQARDDAIPYGHELVEHSDDDNFVPYDPDAEEQHGIGPTTAWEDLPEQTRDETRKAAQEFGHLETRVILALSLVQKRRMLRFVPGRALLRRQRCQLAHQQIAALVGLKAHQVIARNEFFGASYDLVLDNAPDYPDVYEFLEIVGQIDPLVIEYDYDEAFRGTENDLDIYSDSSSDDGDHDDDKGIAIWHLTERERLDRIQRRRAADLDPFIEPEDKFRAEELDQLAEEQDLIQRFQRDLVLSETNPSPPQPTSPPRFRMTYLLNALRNRCWSKNIDPTRSAASAAAAAASRSAPTSTTTITTTIQTSAQPNKRVRFAS